MRKLMLMVVLLASGCCQGVIRQYAETDRLTWEAIAPEYLAQVEASEDLDERQKADRRTLVEVWRQSWQEALEATDEPGQ